MVATIAIISFTWLACAQDQRFFTFELAGSGGFGSFNYEKSIIRKPALPVNQDLLFADAKPYLQLNWRLGFSFSPVDKNNGTVLIFPVMIHAMYGKQSHFFDAGLGQTFSVTTKGRPFIMMPVSAGYRFQPMDRRYYLRVAYTPIISYLVDFQCQHWAGITYGYQLKTKEK